MCKLTFLRGTKAHAQKFSWSVGELIQLLAPLLTLKVMALKQSISTFYQLFCPFSKKNMLNYSNTNSSGKGRSGIYDSQVRFGSLINLIKFYILLTFLISVFVCDIAIDPHFLMDRV